MPRLTITSTPIPVTFQLEKEAAVEVTGALEPVSEVKSIPTGSGLTIMRRLRADPPSGSVYLTGINVRMFYAGSEVMVIQTDGSGNAIFNLSWDALTALGIGVGGPYVFEFWSDEAIFG